MPALVFLELALFLAALVLGLAWLWRLAHSRTVTALVCPNCGGRTALTPSRPDINCRYCRAPLRRGGRLQDGVGTEIFHPLGTGDRG